MYVKRGLRLNWLAVMLMALLWTGSGLISSALAQGSEEATGSDSRSLLADILEDETARQELINELRRAASGETVSMAEPESDAPKAFSRVLAEATQSFAQGLATEISDALVSLSELGSGAGSVNYAEIGSIVLNLVLVIAATLFVFIVLRRFAQPLFAKIGIWATQPTSLSPLLRQTVAVLIGGIVDLAAVALAWVGGYLVALFLVGETGSMDERESLFLNAFLMIEIVKVVIRLIFAYRHDALRLLPMQAEDAAYWNAWLARLTSFIGYGVMVVVPILNVNLSPAVGRLGTVIIMLIAFLYAVAIVMQNKAKVGAKLQETAEESDSHYTRYSFGLMARTWHMAAIAYFAALAIVTLVRPEDALPVLLKATVQMALAIGVGVFLSVVLTQLIGSKIHISDQARLKFPLLEERLNGFIPTLLKVVRVAILIAVVAVILDAWGIFNLVQWLASDAGSTVILKFVTVVIILSAAKASWIVLASWIEHKLNPETGTGEPSAREKTLLTIFRNAVLVTLTILTMMIVLAEIGINIGPLIAGAGVLGLAIGFGAQKLVQDIITGVFIQMENAINTGDVVTAGGITGVAEKLTIRSLGLRDLSGTYHIIPFSSVDSVSNYMRDFAYHLGEYGVAYREDTDEVIVRLREAYEELKTDEELAPSLLDEELEVHGVTALADSSVNVRVRIKTTPGTQWAVGRAYNRLVKRHLDAAGIEIPFPHTTIYFGQEKDGSSPPAAVRLEQLRPSGTESDYDKSKASVNPKRKGDFDDAED